MPNNEDDYLSEENPSPERIEAYHDQHMFQDRKDAGLRLARILTKYALEPGIILAIPRGGIPVGAVLSAQLQMPLEPLISKKIGHPSNPEYAIGAVTLSDRVLLDAASVSQEYIEKETERLRKHIHEQMKKFMGDRKPVSLKGKIVIVVDDGMATGSTLRCTIPMIRREQPEKIIIAVPVAPKEALEALRYEVDELVCLLIPDAFPGVGAFYDDFSQVEDDEVVAILGMPTARSGSIK